MKARERPVYLYNQFIIIIPAGHSSLSCVWPWLIDFGPSAGRKNSGSDLSLSPVSTWYHLL